VVGQAAGYLAHPGPLGAVAQAGAAEYHQHPMPLGQVAGRRQGVLQGVGRMGKVHDRREGLALGDALHAAAYAAHACHGGADGLRRYAL
jgi:hypothetical protein